jgi:hypothetical protein
MDVVFQLSAERVLSLRSGVRQPVQEVLRGLQRAPAALGEPDVGVPAVSAVFSGEEAKTVKAPDRASQALLADAEQRGQV